MAKEESGENRAERAMDSLSGMISKDQADRIAKGEFGNIDVLMKAGRAEMNAKDLSVISNEEVEWLKQSGFSERITLKDRVYRVFNPQYYTSGSRRTERRKLILGESGSTVTITLTGESSQAADLMPIERGDKITLKNLAIQGPAELSSTINTTMSKVGVNRSPVIVDYASVKESIKSADILGMVVEVDAVRRTFTVDSGKEIAVADCKLSDTKNSANASFWGASALSTNALRLNSWIKIEFCSIKKVDSGIRIDVNELSRICANGIFGARMSKLHNFKPK